MELAVDQVGRRGQVRDAPIPRSTQEAFDPGSTHQLIDGLVPDGDAVAQRQLGVHPPIAVDAPGGGVHCADEIGEPGVADGPNRGCPRPPGVVPRLRNTEHPAGHLDGQPLGGHHLGGREPPFGSARSFSNSVARR